MDISEQWISKVAGWKMFKSGKELWKKGSILQVNYDAETKKIRAKIGKNDTTKSILLELISELEIKNKCFCAHARRTGEVCQHAVAVMLHLTNGAAATSQQKTQPTAAKTQHFNPAPLRIELPPNFPKKCETGLTLRLHQKEGEPSTEDLQCCLWLCKIGLKEIPPMLALRAQDVPDFLQSIQNHPTITAAEKRVSVLHGKFPLPVSAKIEGEYIDFSLAEHQKLQHFFIDQFIAYWDEEQRLFSIPKQEKLKLEQKQQLIKNKGVRLPIKAFLSDVAAWENTLNWGQSNLLEQLRIIPAPAQIHLKIEGTTRSLQLNASIRYPSGISLALSNEQSKVDNHFPIHDKNHSERWLIRNTALENQALKEIEQTGFREKNPGIWQLQTEEDILHFLANQLNDWQKKWTVEQGQRLQSLRQNIVKITPNIQLQGTGEDWLAFDYGFRSDAGKDIPKEAVLRMLKAGKRSATSKNGKRIIISALDAEMMEQVLQDTNPTQQAGHYYVSKNQASYLKRLQQYYGKKTEIPLKNHSNRLPKKVQELLRHYQEEGVDWLFTRMQNEGAALLADDMGLGKTLQTLSLLHLLQHAPKTEEKTEQQAEKQKKQTAQKNPALVICPTSLLSNWQEETEKFFPQCKTLILHGTQRKQQRQQIKSVDIVITSYALIARDLDFYREQVFAAIIIDEASIIRNPDTQTAKALRQLHAPFRLALTGTPVENALQDLWSIFEWMMPNYLGTREDFKQRYIIPGLGSQPDAKVLKRLRLRVEPFMLRRTKVQVASDLPAKHEQILWCDLSAQQQSIYQKIHSQGVNLVQDAAKKSKGQAKMQLLTTLLRLRQSCCDLRLLEAKNSSPEASVPLEEVSVKLVQLRQLVRSAKAGGHRMLVFSQFTSMLSLIREELKRENTSIAYLDGSTKNRGQVVKEFQSEQGADVFLISLKAGGYGLNLTAADMVVHFDPWWNPAVEAQATDRAYRIGQTKPVNVYKLVTRHTVEEKIVQLQEKKKHLIGSTVDEEIGMESLSSAEINDLL